MKEHRKRIWVDPFQTGLLVRIAAYILLYQAVAGAFFALCEATNAVFAKSGAEASYLNSTLARTLLALVVLLPPLTMDAVRFTHRLVGPLYRFRKTIRAIAAGERVALVQLRKGDMLLDFQNDFNAMLKHLEQQGYVLLKTHEPVVHAKTPQTVGDMAPAVGHTRA